MRGFRGDLARQVDGAAAFTATCLRFGTGDDCDLARGRGGAFCVLKRLEGGGVVEVEEDVAFLDVWRQAER